MTAEYWDNMAEWADNFDLPHIAEDYRRLAGMHRLQGEIDQANQAGYREHVERGILRGPAAAAQAYTAPAGTGYRGEWTNIGWIDEEHVWEVDHERDGEWGGEVLRRIRNINHTVDVTFASPDEARRMGLLIGGPRTPRQDYPPAVPPYAGLHDAIREAGYYHPAYKVGGYIPTPTQLHPRQVGKAGRPLA